MTVHQAVAAVMADLSHVAKRDTNTQQGFRFRGIDAVVNAVGPVLRKHQVICSPLVEGYEYGSIEVGEKRTPMGHARVTVRYRWFGPDGDSFDSIAVGEAMDSGDKATAKAMSVAWRTCLLQTLALPTDEPDPDADSYERAPHRETDLAWMDTFDARIVAATSVTDLRALWKECADTYSEGRLTDTDKELLDKALMVRKDELEPAS